MFTLAGRAAKRARLFEDIETEIEAADQYRMEEEEDNEMTRIAGELIDLIYRAKSMKTSHSSGKGSPIQCRYH